MRQYRIRGRTRVMGQTAVGGAKNAVLPILAAVCLNKGESVIHNCPRIDDTFLSIEILKHIGCLVELSGNTLQIDASKINEINIPAKWVGKMRSSILFMGAMLGRFGQVNIAYPGGCGIGVRAVDYHIDGLRAMGADIVIEDDILYCKGKLEGADIVLPSASVGATQNLMLAGALAKGTTVIANAAREPEVVDLACFLNKMGASVHGAGTEKITIVEGANKLTNATHWVMPDRIVAGTYLVAAAMTNGDINLTNVRRQDLTVVTSKLAMMGCEISYGKGSIALKGPKRLSPLPYLKTNVYPGFPTDMQAQFVAALSIADGQSTVMENIFESRDAHAAGLNLMGADIRTTQVDGVSNKKSTLFEIYGQPALVGCEVEAKDLRGGAALILAGVAAHGDTVVKNAHYVERGYECIDNDLSNMGANVQLEVVES